MRPARRDRDRRRRRDQRLRLAGGACRRRCSQVSWTGACGRSSCASAGSGTSRITVAVVSGGSDSVIAKIAARLESSPMNRCQSVSGAGLILPRGPMPSTVTPGAAARIQRSPGPSECRTTSRVSSWRPRSSARMVYLRRTGLPPSTSTRSITSWPGRCSKPASSGAVSTTRCMCGVTRPDSTTSSFIRTVPASGPVRVPNGSPDACAGGGTSVMGGRSSLVSGHATGRPERKYQDVHAR